MQWKQTVIGNLKVVVGGSSSVAVWQQDVLACFFRAHACFHVSSSSSLYSSRLGLDRKEYIPYPYARFDLFNCQLIHLDIYRLLLLLPAVRAPHPHAAGKANARQNYPGSLTFCRGFFWKVGNIVGRYHFLHQRSKYIEYVNMDACHACYCSIDRRGRQARKKKSSSASESFSHIRR